MSWINAGVAAVGVGSQLFGASKAKKQQQEATNQALSAYGTANNTIQGLQSPYRDAGVNALQQLSARAQLGGQMPTAEQVQGGAGYQFGLNQGLDAVQGGAAAAGGLYSGAAGKALARYGNDYATTKYNEEFNRQRTVNNDQNALLSSLSGMGQTATNNLQNQAQQYAGNVAGAYLGNANAQGAGTIAQSNTVADAAGQFGSWWNQEQNKPSPYTAPNAYGAYANPTGSTYAYQGATLPNIVRGGWADGGPVQSQGPVEDPHYIRNALLRLLFGNKAGASPGSVQQPPMLPPVAPAASQPPQLLAPALNPRAVMDARERAAGLMDGGPVHGPGGPREDAIPAMLSNGEHVFDAASVNAMGNGNNQQGQNKLNALRAQLKRGR
jgi:hypothetical protein